MPTPPVKPTWTTRAAEAIAQIIRCRIESGELRFGLRLPSQREMAAEHGVADRVITQAIRMLRDTGHVETKPRGQGVRLQASYVREPEHWNTPQTGPSGESDPPTRLPPA